MRVHLLEYLSLKIAAMRMLRADFNSTVESKIVSHLRYVHVERWKIGKMVEAQIVDRPRKTKPCG